ncbi:MAG: HDIG domain-containing protein [Candidatus Omnitrophica bacterium]|nr:HDIG domain-containing protein [Candidatus Omnitrophota bacterium]
MKKSIINNYTLKFILGAISTFLIGSILRLNLLVPTFLLSLVIYLKCRQSQLKYSLLNLIFLFVIAFSVSYFVITHGKARFYIPFSLIPMLATILFNDLELSLVISLATSFVLASLWANRLDLGLIFFVSGMVASILVLNARRRSVIIRAGFISGIIQALLISFTHFLFSGRVNLMSSFFFLLNGVVSSIVVLGVLPLFEYLFKTVTNISLLELADFNHPLLQRMVLEAPGTYHHSLVVGNLSDAACISVGANGLLARIGAYYHDIGKINKPDYFSENQNIYESKHNGLSPHMSKLIIMNHVREGVELAKRYKLNPRLIDFILQHHGNSLVYYFYRRALENLEEDYEIKEEGFRYPGPRPKTKETAIVLLADSVEAATRALENPSPQKIKELVHKIINNRFIDGQLDECDLTLKDLEKIAAVFIRILTGIYHSRISYP